MGLANSKRCRDTPYRLPSNFAEALQLAADQAKQNASLHQVIQQQAPKVQALERLSATDGSICITSAPKQLGIGPLKLFKWLTDDDALMIDGLMGRLLKRYPECGQVLMKYYTTRDSSLMEVGKKMGFGEEKTRGLWKAGIAWIDGALDIRRQAA